MVIGSIFLILSLAVVVSLFITLPLMDHAGSDELVANRDMQECETRRSILLSDRDRLLNALLELDADNELGKIPPEEYAPLREKMVHEAAETLRCLDEMNLAKDQISKSSLLQSDDDDLEALIASRRKELSDSAKGLPGSSPDGSFTTDEFQAYCIHCGKPLMPGDKFCSVCGKSVTP
ncbi:MAG: zinc ribbon domain-containing protein [Chloroflexi bacterium]|nr:zinc ribbon domain-containing protein [Chloroflexota bacterium]